MDFDKIYSSLSATVSFLRSPTRGSKGGGEEYLKKN